MKVSVASQWFLGAALRRRAATRPHCVPSGGFWAEVSLQSCNFASEIQRISSVKIDENCTQKKPGLEMPKSVLDSEVRRKTRQLGV